MRRYSCNPLLSRIALFMSLFACSSLYAGGKETDTDIDVHLCQQALIKKPDQLDRDNFDGTVTDTETGLVWQKCSLGYSWKANEKTDPFDDVCEAPEQIKNKAPVLTRFDWHQAQDAIVKLNEKNEQQSLWRLPFHWVAARTYDIRPPQI